LTGTIENLTPSNKLDEKLLTGLCKSEPPLPVVVLRGYDTFQFGDSIGKREYAGKKRETLCSQSPQCRNPNPLKARNGAIFYGMVRLLHNRKTSLP
jgi:hypothetical protein